ncbi:M56 family metallopeptidase [Microlunatus soli]|uniref:Peptidase family M48 n=1 Tax=Microlunatus soli TaxID=630515 RepID=A0A1H1Z7T7_9ACTN|nr:M56 family metallopeptidase [Microlunatus soli]SDT29637.1 Peptidase family M48 [Microlunatus soli]
MQPDVVICLLAPLLAVPIARATTRWLHPRTATMVITVSAVVLAATSCIGLGILVIGALARWDIVSESDRIAHRSVLLRQLTIPPVAAVATLALTAASVAAIGYGIRRLRSLVRSHRHARSFAGPDRIVVTASPAADAYAIPGRPARIVVSRGMITALDATDFDALLAHEHAHLDHGHHGYVSVVRLAAAANPFLRPLVPAVEFAIERWADEHAAQVTGDRRAVAVAITKAALATGPRTDPGALPAVRLAMAAPIASRADGPVPRRVRALLTPTPRSNSFAMAASCALTAITAWCAAEAAGDLGQLLALAPGSLT